MIRNLTTLLLFLVGLSLPFEWANVTVAGLSITPSKVLTAALLAVAVLRAALEPQRRIQDRKRVWVVVFGVAIAVSTVHAYFRGVPVASLVAATITWYSLIAFYFLVVFLVRDRKDLDALLIALVIGCVAVTATGFLGLGFSTWSAEGERIGGQGGNSNLLAFNLAITLPVTLIFLYGTRNPLWKAALGGVALVLLAGIGAALSRAALLSIPFMGALWMVRLRVRNVLAYALPVLLLAAAAAYLMPDAVAERVSTLDPTKARTDDSITSRAHTNRLGLKAFAESPLIGIGSLRFFSYAIENSTPFANVIHNAYLDIAAEEGLLGLIPFVAISVLTWTDFTRAQRRARDPRAGAVGIRELEVRAVLLQAAFVGVLVNAQFQPIQRAKGFWLIFALSTAIARMTLVRASGGAMPEPNRSLSLPSTRANRG